ncbi:MAG: alpha-L-fucosidase [Dysgonamonadaceae bacterium]|nr:alpha-L-fucosidase [Dysgonamonadaceae bacterium]
MLGKYTLAVAMLSLSVLAHSQQGFVHKSSSEYVVPTDKQVLEKLNQWQDLKFGVLFHWGLYSVPGIVESWSICSEDEDWIPRDSTIAYDEYKKWYWGLIDQFNPTGFNPEQWARVTKNAGMKYMIFTTKHHDGFALFDTKQSDFSILHGAFKNNSKADVTKHILNAFRAQNFMVGTYFSKPDWHSEYYWWSRYATANRNVNYKIERHRQRWEKFRQFTYNQIEELMSGYGDVDILWLDGGWVAAPRQDIKMDEIADMARSHQPGLIVVDRTIHGKNENYLTPERSIPDKQLPFPWESCITLSNDWGWVPNAPFKSPNEVIALLVEVVAKGGNLLLGVGPTPEGVIQPEVVDRLEKIGDWLRVNGKGIYNTRITPIYNSGDVWFTADKDGETLYAIYVPAKDSKETAIEWEGNIPRKGSKITFLQSGKSVKWTAQEGKVKIVLPDRFAEGGNIKVFAFKKEPQ